VFLDVNDLVLTFAMLSVDLMQKTALIDRQNPDLKTLTEPIFI
jgi:hypothetical protein